MLIDMFDQGRMDLLISTVVVYKNIKILLLNYIDGGYRTWYIEMAFLWF